MNHTAHLDRRRDRHDARLRRLFERQALLRLLSVSRTDFLTPDEACIGANANNGIYRMTIALLSWGEAESHTRALDKCVEHPGTGQGQ